MNDSLLDLKPNDGLKLFLEQCDQAGLDTELIKRLCPAVSAYYNGNTYTEAELKEWTQLLHRWYDSLSNGPPDYSVYGVDEYMADVWVCWMKYSRVYLRALKSKRSLGTGRSFLDTYDPKVILDLGCGMGWTTAAFAQLCPNAQVFGTNLKDTAQWSVASSMGKQYGFEVVESCHEIGEAPDLVFASEYFEHIVSPVQHMNDVASLKPKTWVIANAFRPRAIGHFPAYFIGGKWEPNTNAGRLFNKALRQVGHESVKTKLFNNRPMIWKLK